MTGIIIAISVILILFLLYIVNKDKKILVVKPTGSASIMMSASFGIEPVFKDYIRIIENKNLNETISKNKLF